MRSFHFFPALLTGIASLLLTLAAFAGVTITLSNDFIEVYKDRATIDANVVIDQLPSKPHAAKDDGDMHVACRSNGTGLPMVAELKNAKYLPDAVSILKTYHESSDSLPVMGAWRFWCEHSGNHDFVQWEAVSPATNTNPDHVFEIHPIVSLDDQSFSYSFQPIDGFVPKTADAAFEKYLNTTCHLSSDGETTTIETKGVGYNHVEFILEVIDDEPWETEDAVFRFARIHAVNDDGSSGEVVDFKRRMVFIKDTYPAIFAEAMQKGDELRVLGLPRISLKLVSWRVEHKEEKPYVMDWNLPFEIVVYAIYEEEE